MSAASLLPRQCLARAPANLHDRKGSALISHGHLPALSSFYSACVCHCRARVRILLIPTRDKPTPAPAYTAHTHKTDTRGDGAHPQAPRGGDPAATGRGIPTPAPVWRYRRAARDDAAILEDLSSLILGLERCDGLREIVQQIESGAVKKIRDRYGPAAPGCRGTADPMWSKYSNLVSKRERLGRILEIDFSHPRIVARNKKSRKNHPIPPPQSTFGLFAGSSRLTRGVKLTWQPSAVKPNISSRAGNFPRKFGTRNGDSRTYGRYGGYLEAKDIQK
ncbi:hypothetical protein C8J57DRAFT_1221384 [Mycena rebaudengoi]|nr:hypothetical protein C8J57DRAFT_1221384 [Mycena rebaudengoi]